ncbi:MAG: VCBS domain-containing protein [Planctomycetota bacterium]|nr:VCBS domain-containing protein [Planctomycetota bacterium]
MKRQHQSLIAKNRKLLLESLELRQLMAANVFNDNFDRTNANSSYSPAITLNVLGNDNNGGVNQEVSSANIDFSASNKTANTATYVFPDRPGTTTPQKSLIVGSVDFLPSSNYGDINVAYDTDNLNNGAASLLPHSRLEGIVLASTREIVTPNGTGNASNNLAVLNYNNTFVSMVSGPANNGETMVPVGLARFPFSVQSGDVTPATYQGWVAGSFNTAGTPFVEIPGSPLTVTKTGTGEYSVAVAGVTDSRQDGFLFSIGSGNSDNYSRATPIAGTNQWRVVVRDNASTFAGGEDDADVTAGFNLLYVPKSAQGLIGGHVRGDVASANPMIQSFGNVGIQRTSNGNWTMSVPGHTPTSGMLVIESADYDRARGANVYFTYQAAPNGTDFLIRQTQFEGTATNLLNDDFVVFFIPFENQLATSSPLTISQLGTAAAPNSGLSTNGVAVTVNADKTVNYAYDFTTLRGLAQGENVVDTFVYQATDGVALSSATVTITLRGVNDAPYITSVIPNQSFVEDGAAQVFDLATFFADYDTTNTITYTVAMVADAPVTAVVTGSTLTITPIADRFGSYSFTVTATDNNAGSVTSALVTGVVSRVTEGSKAVPDLASTAKDSAVTISVLANDFDPENSAFSVAAANISANVAATTDATSAWAIAQASAAPNNITVVTPLNLGDLTLNRNGVRIQQSNGILLGTSSENTTPWGTVNSYGNVLGGSTTSYVIATDRGLADGERDTPIGAGFFPFAEGWTSGHVDNLGQLRLGIGVSASNVVRTAAGLWEVTIPEATNSETSGYLFAITASNDDNIMSVRPIPGTNRWQVRNTDNDSVTTNATTGVATLEDDGFSFVYIPASTPNLVAGRIAAGTLVQSTGSVSATVAPNGAVTVSVAGQTPTTGTLLAIGTGTTTALVNAVSTQMPANEATMFEPIGNDFRIAVRTSGTFAQVAGDVQFLFLPFASPLERLTTNTFSVTSVSPTSQLGAAVTLNPNGTVNYNPTVAGGAIAALAPGQSLVDTFTYSITDTNGQTSSTTVSVTVSGDLVVVTPISGLTTTEAGGQASFSVVLSVPPTSDVTVALSSSDLTEGALSASSLVFTPLNWSTPQNVTVTGQDDFIVDGSINYTVVTSATSADVRFEGVAIPDVSLVNTDNDTIGVSVTPTTGLTTSERGGTATFSVVLRSQPSAAVSFTLSSSNLAEGTVSAGSLTFTTTDWNVPQIVTITGVGDALVDGNIAYNIVTDAIISTDLQYNGVNPANVSVTNIDLDVALITSAGVTQYGSGQAGVGIDGRIQFSGTEAYLTGGTLTVSISQNSNANDRIEIRNVGTGAGQVSVSGSNVSVGGVEVGSFVGGVGAPLVITFNANATRANAQTVARSITYRDVTVGGSGTRTATFALVDGDGQVSAPVNKSINIGLVRVLELQEGVDRGFGTYSGARDIQLAQNNPNAPLPIGGNAAEGLLVDFSDSTTAPNETQVLLRFEDIVGAALGQVPAGAIITSASLQVNTNNSGHGAVMHRMLQNWSDTTSSWNSLVDGISSDGIEATLTPESIWGAVNTTGVTGGGLTSVSVLNDVRAWQSGASNFGWFMKPHVGGTDGWGFSPSEAAVADQRPMLRIEWVPAGTTSVVFQEGLNGYAGTKDTSIGPSTVDSLGEAGSVGSDFAGGTVEQGLLRFDEIIGNAIGQVPPNSVIHSAVLTLATFGSNGMGDGAAMRRMLQTWDENAVWTTFTDGIQANGVEASGDITAQAGNSTLNPDAQAGFVSFEMARDVQAWVNGTENHGWAFLPWDNGTNGWFFQSSESTLASPLDASVRIQFPTLETKQQPSKHQRQRYQ